MILLSFGLQKEYPKNYFLKISKKTFSMKKAFLLFMMGLLILSCKSVTPVKSVIAETENDAFAYYFTASGNEPFWSLKIGEEETILKSLNKDIEQLVFSSVTPIKAMDANVKQYKWSNPDYNLVATISKKDCVNSMSGAVSAYSVTLSIMNKISNKSIEIQGCGRYLTDYRLHDIWALEELNGKKISLSDFQNEVPRIEIYASENRFMGFGGCNSINGTLFFEKDILRFSNIMSTMMACDAQNKENEFIKSLQSTTTYFIENNRLSLSNPSGLVVVFRKID